MQCYTEIVPPSGITHALAVPFTSASDTNLIVARTALLQIFSTKNIDQGQDTKLVLVAEFQLSGTITSLGRVQIQNTKSGGYAVLIAFRDAKLSLIEWDPSLHTISTISIHYYENHASQTAPWNPGLKDCVNHLTIDPNSRCAAFNFGISNLAIIPFHQIGDDLAMDDIDGEPLDRVATKHTNGDSIEHAKPYFPSFVLSLTTLDPALLHPLDFAFLHEYRDPTVGILYTTAARSNNMSSERRDVTIYSVYAMEIENRVSTTLQSVSNLPNDIFAILALPVPVGGALLVGGNELIHIDQGGKPTGIAVNEFAREASSFPLADHSTCHMKLEGCRIEQLGNSSGDMLVVLNTGEMALLSFRLDGRSVSGLSLRRLDAGHLSDLVSSSATCTANVTAGTVFIGMEDAHSVLLATGRRQSQLKRTASRMQVAANGHNNGDGDAKSDTEGDDDDDLYGEIANASKPTLSNDAATGLNISVLDTLPCIGPLHNVSFGRSLKRKRDIKDDGDADTAEERLTLTAACGRGQAGGLAIMSPNFTPSETKRIRECEASSIWSFGSSENQHIILSEAPSEGPLQSSLWTVKDDKIERVEGTDFEASTGSTLAVFSINTSKHTVHVTSTEIRVYDSDFGLSQIFPIVDEDENQSARALRASFVEPFLVLLKDDLSMTLLKADRKGELEELDLPESLADNITSASLFLDRHDFFQASRFQRNKSPEHNILLLLVTKDGALVLLPMANPKVQIFQTEGLQYLPTHLAPNTPVPKHWRHKDELCDVILASIGDEIDQQPYMIIRNTTGDVTIYEPYALPEVVGSFEFKKTASRNAEYNPENEVDEDGETTSTLPPLRIIDDLEGFSSVFIPGHSSRIILKHASTPPRIYAVENVKSVCCLRGRSGQSGFLFIDDGGDVCMGRMPSTALIGTSDWMIKKIDLGQDVVGITYFPTADAYAVAADFPDNFKLPQDDEWHPDWQKENASFLPTIARSSLKLISGKNHRILSQHYFGADERVLCIQTMNLEVSEKSHETKDLLVVGTAVTKGENVVTRGNIYLFDIAHVVPQADKTAFDLKLKLLTHEEVRGAVTSICSIGSQGFVLAAQGQKCMVRGLREDMSILPVAFMDMRYYVHVAKSLGSTGLTILGDAFSGLWLMGYSEEPYKMQLLGRDLEDPDCLAADFLPADKELFIVSSDADGQLRVLQYDPENPKAERGTKLLLRSTFDTGAVPTSMTLLPRTPTSYEQDSQPVPSEDAMVVDSPTSPSQQLLITTQGGSLALMAALSEPSYRRLSTLQNILLTQLDHPCSLNPRAYRAVETDGIGGRGVIDGDLVTRWLNLSSQHKASLADKVGARGVWELRSDMELILGSSGMRFLK